jgi:hypothetical protein
MPPREPADSNLIDQTVSDRTIEANRENAKKSAGPRSELGLLVSKVPCERDRRNEIGLHSAHDPSAGLLRFACICRYLALSRKNL